MTTMTTGERALAECASEPIHLLGRTQAFGLFLALDRERRVAAVSGNSQAWCGRPPPALLGTRANALLPARSLDAAYAHGAVAMATGHVQHLHRVAWPGRADAVDVSLHQSDGLLVIEAEPAGVERAGAISAVEQCTRELAGTLDVDGIAVAAAAATAKVTGYDRVMVYRFSADGSGTVIAEHRARGQRPYLGLRYPASDIPPQARALYLRNPSRVIVDVHDDGLPVHTTGGRTLDLSHSVLRSVSPVHLQYLRHMGTAASMSVSLIVDGRLWGLIVCHHRQALRPALASRGMAELLGRLVSLALSRAERRPLENDIRRLLFSPPGVDQLLDATADAAAHEAACKALSRAIGTSGIVTVIDGRRTPWGRVPTAAQTEALIAALATQSPAPVHAVEAVGELASGLRDLLPTVAGALALPLGSTGRDWVLLLRDEVVRHVRWAGSPEKPVQRGPDGRLSPRQSFATWRASVMGRCEPWTVTEIELAQVLRTRLNELLAARLEQRATETMRSAAQQQALLVRELNHRVRNMLGLIKGLVQQTARNAHSVGDLATRLNDRIHAMSRAYTQIERGNWQPTSLVTLLQAETSAFGEPGQLRMKGPPVLLEPQAYLAFAMVIHELATNARKYGALSVPQGRVTVTWRGSTTGALALDWLESGGPPVQPPAREGFGSRVIRQGLEHQLRGHAIMDFDPAGLHVRLWSPRGCVPPPPEAAPAAAVPRKPASQAAVPAPAAAPAVALVVEDDFVIALLAESMLRQLGCARVITVGTADEALRQLETQPVDFAMLDVNLGDHSSEPVAMRLAGLGVPTIVTTGYSETDSVPEPLRRLRRLTKPYTQAELAAAMSAEWSEGVRSA